MSTPHTPPPLAQGITPGPSGAIELLRRVGPDDTWVAAIVRPDTSVRLTRVIHNGDLLALARALIQEAIDGPTGLPLTPQEMQEAHAALACLPDPDADEDDDLPPAHDPDAAYVGAQPPDGGAQDAEGTP